jgi:hypothetical protein
MRGATWTFLVAKLATTPYRLAFYVAKLTAQVTRREHDSARRICYSIQYANARLAAADGKKADFADRFTQNREERRVVA